MFAMKSRGHRKQILLFLVTVLLPSLVLIGLTVRMIGQEKELAQKRLTEEDRKWHYKVRFGDRKLPPRVKLKYPKHYYPYNYLFCDDEGRTYVRTYQKAGQGEVFFDVFDSEGRYIAKFTRPVGEMPSIIKKGKMYSLL